MPIPLIPIISALAAGGTLVPHAAGGLIVTNVSGYVAGTYLSTAAISGLITTASATLGAGALYFSGAAASIIGSAGIFGTTIGATGITGALMSVGIVSATPVWIPLAAGGAACGAALGCGYGGYRFYKLRHKVSETPEDEEAQFTEMDAKIIEKIIKLLAKKGKPDSELLDFKNINTPSTNMSYDSLLQSALSGDKEAQYEIALKYLNGDGIPKDEKAFENWASKAYEQGHVGALYELANYHRFSDSKMRADLTGEKFIDHIVLAYREFKLLAESGLLEAQEILGEMYRAGEGFGIEPNREKSMHWYSIAASNGSKKATDILIYMESHPNDAML